MKNPIIRVVYSPAALDLKNIREHIVVVIDILRATSTICVALQHGAAKVIPVATVEECLAYKGTEFVLAAERQGNKVQGFQYGNSPFEYMNGMESKTLVLTTTNGTRAINAAKGALDIAAGSFLNITTVVSWLRERSTDTILLCSGWKDRFSLEDSLYAGALVSQLKDTFEIEGDEAIASGQLYDSSHDDLLGFVKKSDHYKRLANLGIEKDMSYCLTLDQTNVLPLLKDGALVNIMSN